SARSPAGFYRPARWSGWKDAWEPAIKDSGESSVVLVSRCAQAYAYGAYHCLRRLDWCGRFLSGARGGGAFQHGCIAGTRNLSLHGCDRLDHDPAAFPCLTVDWTHPGTVYQVEIALALLGAGETPGQLAGLHYPADVRAVARSPCQCRSS